MIHHADIKIETILSMHTDLSITFPPSPCQSPLPSHTLPCQTTVAKSIITPSGEGGHCMGKWSPPDAKQEYIEL